MYNINLSSSYKTLCSVSNGEIGCDTIRCLSIYNNTSISCDDCIISKLGFKSVRVPQVYLNNYLEEVNRCLE